MPRRRKVRSHKVLQMDPVMTERLLMAKKICMAFKLPNLEPDESAYVLLKDLSIELGWPINRVAYAAKRASELDIVTVKGTRLYWSYDAVCFLKSHGISKKSLLAWTRNQYQ